MNAPLPRETATAGPFTLPALPWGKGALEPVISKRTVELHHGKHHRTYVEKLNELVAGTDLARLTLHEIVKRTHGDARRVEVFNNAGQALNHAFYWESLAPHAAKPPAEMRQLLDRDLGGYDAFVAEFTKAATGQFGSGWAWLVSERQRARDPHYVERRYAGHTRHDAAPDDRRVGACVLSRLPEQA